MHLDVDQLSAFYRSPLGQIARQRIGQEVRGLWPKVTAERVAGIGHASPYLQPFVAEAERVVALMPAAAGVLHWPREGPNATALAFEEELPLPDSSIDRILMVHLLEGTRDPLAVMREAWRVLVPSGRLLAVVPYRSGPWARADHTPFGLGRPYSRGQLTALMGSALFEVHETRRFLFTPPSGRRMVLGSSQALERIGPRLWPRFAGMLAVAAQKEMVRGVRVSKPARGLGIFVPGLKPVRAVNMQAPDGARPRQPAGPAAPSASARADRAAVRPASCSLPAYDGSDRA